MNTKAFLLSGAIAFPAIAFSQSAIDALSLSRNDLRGTARYMSMGGAFGALGGDLTTLSQNPGGIGVYRSHELGFTLNLDPQSASAEIPGSKTTNDQTKFYLNNIGGVLTLKLNSDVAPNLNFGFTYNKTASFNRKFSGSFGQLQNSATNWMAGITNANGVTIDELEASTSYDGAIPWISTLGYYSLFINPIGNMNSPNWEGQWGSGTAYDEEGNFKEYSTSGFGDFAVTESGGIDSFNIAFGGNFGNIVYWGMDFDITSITYQRNTYYGESLQNAWVENDNGEVVPTTSEWNLNNYYRLSGNGFSYKLGLIFRPIQELRLGFAFHTPTFYSLSQEFAASADHNYNNEGFTPTDANNGYPGYSNFRFRSPWRIIASAAGVIGSNFIISADYEWAQYSRMNYSDPAYNDYYYDSIYFPTYNSYDTDGTNDQFREYLNNTSTFRVGAEFRVTPSFSVRAGYSNVSSPVKEAAKNGSMVISTAGTQPSYCFDNSTNYITCGLGYRYNGFYGDIAYVYKHTDATYYGFTPDPGSRKESPKSKVGFTQNQIVLSLGYKF